MKRYLSLFWLPLLILLGLAASVTQTAVANRDDYCPMPIAPAISTRASGSDLILTWHDHAANDGGYRIWRSPDTPFFTPDEGELVATLDQGANQLVLPDIFRESGSGGYYLVEALSACTDDTRLSAHVGAAAYDLNNDGGNYTLLTVPFNHPDIDDAASLATALGNVSALLQWNPETQGFRFFAPPGSGTNFPVLPGDAVFVQVPAKGPDLAAFHGALAMDDHPLARGGYSFLSLPFQRDDLTRASQLAEDITEVTALLRWNESTQGFQTFIPPSGNDFEVAPGDPVITLLGEAAPPRWPGVDNGMLQWAQMDVDGQNRHVLLQWRDGQSENWPPGGYEIFRRRSGSSSWQQLDSIRFAQDAATMETILGRDVKGILAYDLRGQNENTPLSTDDIYDRLRQEPGLAMAFAGQYTEVAEAIGMAYLDQSAADGVDYEYYVARADDGELIARPVCTPAEPNRIPASNLRESMITDVPPGLGVNPSPRPLDAVERYQWGAYQNARQMDGRAHLIWDEPAPVTPPADPFQCVDSPALQISGYHLYRRGPASNNAWEQANRQTVGAALTGSQRRLLIDPGAIPPPGSPDDEPYFFMDPVAEAHAGAPPADIYADWEYALCAVDGLGQEISCPAPITVPIRELTPPAGAFDADISVDVDHTVLTYTWSYTDTSEISLPLTFHVTRSDDFNRPAEQWTDLTPGGISAPAASPTFTLSITDTPPAGRQFWYQVQVRDNAGNWSQSSAAISGGLYDRTPPSKPSIPTSQQCEQNSFPFTLTGLDSDVVQVALYRAFDPAGPYELIKRFPVTQTIFGGSATLEELYVPPGETTLYYRVEAIDGHGNVSPAADLCVDHGQDQALPPPVVSIGDGNSISYTTGTTADVITITVDGPEGTTTITGTNNSGLVPSGLLPGQMGRVTVEAGNEGGGSGQTVIWIYETNNFMDTGRHMHELGDLWDIYWDNSTGEPRVALELESDVEEMPWAAAFRRVQGGNWMQVTPIQPTNEVGGARVLYDTTDVRPTETYSYTVLAFSPTSHEVLGYWTETQLPAQSGAASIDLTDPFQAVQDPGCLTNEVPHSGATPNPIVLPNGWRIDIVQLYFGSGGSGCPTGVDLNNLSGSGDLWNGAGPQWNVEFYGISIDGAGNLTGGRITNVVNEIVAPAGELRRYVSQLGFEPGAAEAEMRIFLPQATTLVDPATGDSSPVAYAVGQNVDGDFNFDPIPYTGAGSGVTLIDENLPWRLAMNGFTLSPLGIAPDGDVSTIDRFSYSPRTDGKAPDNNLGFLRRGFSSSNASVDVNGLNGTFDTTEPLEYQTGMPAALVLDVGPTVLDVAGGTIQNGEMETYFVSLLYDWMGTSQDSFAPNTNEFFLPCYWTLAQPSGGTPAKECTAGPVYLDITRLRIAEMFPEVGMLEIGTGGTLTGKMINASASFGDLVWPNFDVSLDGLGDAQLYVAAAAFPEEDPALRREPQAPMATEIAWRQLPDPDGSPGDLDPGVNLIKFNDAFNFYFYDPSLFAGDMDLYLRRGGMSEQIKVTAPDSTPRVNQFGYQESVTRFEVLFIDNWISPDDTLLEMDLYLPYPSDVSLPLSAGEWDCNMPVGGDVRSAQALQHKYWDFNQEIDAGTAWDYVPVEETMYPTQYEENVGTPPGAGDLPQRIFALQDGTATGIAGLMEITGPDTVDRVDLRVRTQWFPTGDYGRVLVTSTPTDYYYVSGVPYAFTGLKLSHYHVGFLDTSSLPDTMGLEQELTGTEFPAALLNAGGTLTPQSLKDCSAGDTVGCGFILLDGNGTADYFGEVEPVPAAAGRGLDFLPNPPDFLGDDPLGQFPIAINSIDPKILEAVFDPTGLKLYVAFIDGTIDELCPFVFLPNQTIELDPLPISVPVGGVFACLKSNVSLLSAPAPQVLNADLGLVADFSIFGETEIGAFFGYAASQATFRALAMNRPRDDGQPGVVEYDSWNDVSDDIASWAEKFGYAPDDDRTNRNDPVDLAYELWPAWSSTTVNYTNPCRPNPAGDLTFRDTDEVLEPHLQTLNGVEAYGIGGLEGGAGLQFLNPPAPFDWVEPEVWFDTGFGQAIFCVAGGDFRLENIFFGAEFGVELGGDKPMLRADWVSLNMNRDGDYIITARDIEADFMTDSGTGVDLNLLILESDPTNKRIEGAVHVRELDNFLVVMNGIDLHMVSGLYNNEEIFFVGGQGSVSLVGIEFGLEGFYGNFIPDHPLIISHGFEDISDQFTAADLNTVEYGFTGFFGTLYAGFDFDDFGCLMEATARGELRVWYWEAPNFASPRFGGTLFGSLSGQVACLLSARGDVSLTFEMVPIGFDSTPPPGWPSLTSDCVNGLSTYPGCFAASGTAWVATGIGFDCDQRTWDGWESRWWGDSWCWTFGAGIGLVMMWQNDFGDYLKFDFDIDFE